MKELNKIIGKNHFLTEKDNLILHVSDPRDDGIFALEAFYKLQSLKGNKKSKLIMVDASQKAEDVASLKNMNFRKKWLLSMR